MAKIRIALEMELEANEEELDNLKRSDIDYKTADLILGGVLTVEGYSLQMAEGEKLSLSNPKVDTRICKVIDLLSMIELDTTEIFRK